MLNSRKPLVVLAVGLAFGLALSSPLLAQDAAPQLIQVNLLQVKPDKVERFRELHRDVFIPAAKAAGRAWRVTRSTEFGPSFEMAVSFPLNNYAELDQEPGGSANENALAGEVWRTCVDSRRSFIVQARPELSMEPEPQSDLVRRVRIVVADGKNAEFEALWTEKILPALAKSGAKGYSVFQTVLGGNTSEYFGLMPIANFAALDGWGPFQALSEEETAQLLAESGALIETLEIDVTRLDRELSYGLPGLE